MLESLSTDLGVALRPRTLVFDDGTRVELEGADTAGIVLVQLLPNRGAYRPAFRNKVLADLFKLAWLRTELPQARRAILLATPTVLPGLGGWVPRAAASTLTRRNGPATGDADSGNIARLESASFHAVLRRAAPTVPGRTLARHACRRSTPDSSGD